MFLLFFFFGALAQMKNKLTIIIINIFVINIFANKEKVISLYWYPHMLSWWNWITKTPGFPKNGYSSAYCPFCVIRKKFLIAMNIWTSLLQKEFYGWISACLELCTDSTFSCANYKLRSILICDLHGDEISGDHEMQLKLL